MRPCFLQGEENDFDLFIDKFLVEHGSRISWGQMVQQKVPRVNKSYICVPKCLCQDILKRAKAEQFSKKSTR